MKVLCVRCGMSDVYFSVCRLRGRERENKLHHCNFSEYLFKRQYLSSSCGEEMICSTDALWSEVGGNRRREAQNAFYLLAFYLVLVGKKKHACTDAPWSVVGGKKEENGKHRKRGIILVLR